MSKTTWIRRVEEVLISRIICRPRNALTELLETSFAENNSSIKRPPPLTPQQPRKKIKSHDEESALSVSQASHGKHLQTKNSQYVTAEMDSNVENTHKLNSSVASAGKKRNDSTLSQLLWVLQYLKFNPPKTNDEVVEMITTLCNGMNVLLKLSPRHMGDKYLRRTLRISRELFTLLQIHKPESLPETFYHVKNGVENLFDNVLYHMQRGKTDAESQLRGYGFVSALLMYLDDKSTRAMMVEKLLTKIEATTVTMWSVYCLKITSTELLDPCDINLFYIYCQLLQLAITSVTWTPAAWIEQSISKRLFELEDASVSLFALLPNLAYVLYPATLAAQKYCINT